MLQLYTVSTVEEEMFDNKKILKKSIEENEKNKNLSEWSEYLKGEKDMLCFTFQICLSIYA